MTKFYKKEKFQNSGFTLVETLIAIFIFSLSIIAVMLALAQQTSSINYAKKKMTASYLAQEGIEYVRNMRDASLFYAGDKNEGWNIFIAKLKEGGCDSEGGCYFDCGDLICPYSLPSITETKLIPCDKECSNLLSDKDTGTYGYFAGEDSGFSRKINFITTGSDLEIRIFSTVSWTQLGAPSQILFSEDLTEWVQ